MSRRGRRNRGRGNVVSGTVVKAPQTGVTFSPQQVQALLNLQQGKTQAKLMPRPETWSTDPFGPGRALPPAPINVPRPDTGRADPRSYQYDPAVNLQLTTRQGHVPWATLQAAADQPLFRKCIQLRKTICDLEFSVTVDPAKVARYAELDSAPKQDVESNLRQKYRNDIARLTDFFQTPDRKNGFSWSQWTGLIMENYLKYDAVAIWPQYTYGGDIFAFKVIDGKTIKPLQDEYGERPLPPFPAFQQILYGFPRGEWTASVENVDGKEITPGYPSDQLLYERRIIRNETPYGMSPTEIALIEGLLWSKRFSWMLSEFTEGVQPDSFLLNKGEVDWTPEQVTEYERFLNQRLGGNIAERMKWPLLPPGIEPVQSVSPGEKYKPEYDLFIIKLVAGCFGIPVTELNFVETGSLGATFHEGNEDILYRQTRRPDADWLGGVATKLARAHLGMSPDLKVQILGLESEDEAAADAVAQTQVNGGRLTINEDRARRGLPPYDFAEADMPMLMTQRGVVFLEGASEVEPPGVLVTPVQGQPLQAPPIGPDGQPLPPAQGAPGGPPQGKQPPKPTAQITQPADTKQDAKSGKKPPAKPAAKASLDKHAPARSISDEVYAQLTEDYPASSLDWVLHTAWEGPQMVPLAQIDTSGRSTWRASHEGDKVDMFADKIRHKQGKGKQIKPVVLVRTPGASKNIIIDGHHRFLAYEQLNGPVWAYIGHVSHTTGPWDSLHDFQFSNPDDLGEKSPADADAGAKADDTAKAATELRTYRRWLSKRAAPGRTFEFSAGRAAVLELDPSLADDPRVTFKDLSPPPGYPAWENEWDSHGGACPVCKANEDGGPKWAGALYPSGHNAPPAHPNCQCDLIPARKA